MIGGYGSAVQGTYCPQTNGHTVAKIKAQWEAGQRFFLHTHPFKCKLSKHLWVLFLHCNPLKTPTLGASGILADLLILDTVLRLSKIRLNIISACVSLSTRPPETADSGQTRWQEPLKASNNKNIPTVRRRNKLRYLLL